MLFIVFLANITTLLCFFLFRVIFNNFFTMPVNSENPRLKLAFPFATGAPITFSNNAIEMLPLVSDKTINPKTAGVGQLDPPLSPLWFFEKCIF